MISEEEIKLSEEQNRFVESGWGKEVSEETIVKKIIYESDGHKVNGYLGHPVKTDTKLPLIIWNRGGSGKGGYIDEFLARGMFGEIASWGYVVLASQYREADEFGGNDVNDVLKLFEIADNISFCDSERIGMEGWSRGGMMTYRVLTETNRVKCAVIISGLANLLRSFDSRDDMKSVFEKTFGSEDNEEFVKRMKSRSAVFFADKIDKSAKILLIHGTEDTEVATQDSIEMYELLKKRGIQCRLELIENGDHYLKKNRKETIRLRREWFDKYLKNS